jgi:propanediol dehydratase small subunit
MRFRALSGRLLEEITLDEGLAGNLGPADLRIHADTLRLQAGVAEQNGNVQLADNLRRAAELAGIDDADLLRIYEALRPRRATRDELETIAAELDGAGAANCAAFVREAAEVYARRGLTRSTVDWPLGPVAAGIALRDRWD